jgi:hypothetical protein
MCQPRNPNLKKTLFSKARWKPRHFQIYNKHWGNFIIRQSPS